MPPPLIRLLPFLCCILMGVGCLGAAVESDSDVIPSEGEVPTDEAAVNGAPVRPAATAGVGGKSDAGKRTSIDEPGNEGPDEVLWRQVILENGRVVVVRDRLPPEPGARFLRDVFLISNGVVVDRIPLDPKVEVLEQLRLISRVQPLTGLVPAESVNVFIAMEFLRRPTPQLPPEIVESLGGIEAARYWHQVVIAEGRVMIFWDRLTEGDQPVRDGFMIDRQEVVSHMFLDAGGDAVRQAGIFAADVFRGDTANLGPLEPAAEGNVLIVAHYLDDFGGQGAGQLGGDFELKPTAGQQSNPNPDPLPVSPSGGIGGF